MATKIELNGYDFSDSEKKFVKTTLNYKEPDPTKAYAHGEPTSIYAAKVFLKNYWDEIKDSADARQQNIAFTFGKESLLSILSQEDCVGIKFYLGQRKKEDCPVGYVGKWPGKTLVAIGIKNDAGETEIGADRDYIARGLDTSDLLAKSGNDISDTQPGFVIEAIPPFTYDNIPKP
jgi:hypothetical protein